MNVGIIDQEYKTAMISMLRALMGKVDTMKEQMDNVHREMEIPRKNQIDMIGIKNNTKKEFLLVKKYNIVKR